MLALQVLATSVAINALHYVLAMSVAMHEVLATSVAMHHILVT